MKITISKRKMKNSISIKDTNSYIMTCGGVGVQIYNHKDKPIYIKSKGVL